ncbi:PD-(D/E)XK nuclease family protein [Cryobacterium tagatosivorans]|uniref:Uncharacterized protein n=1 Tax=Cryobacterium tagatosivorans TaxID=1259199 RepID=A0A4R8UJI5_9MICO|nr:PD-(D/E)XK nuclease family protein [Cryobacterium tagatosivorans]TFB54416.1 hypothetical protein E3O23_03660 [Cryobacterium tagatosivorans]
MLSDESGSWVGDVPIPSIDAPTIMVVINRAWREGDDDAAVYEATRGNWRIAKGSRERAQYVLGVAGGIVRGAYRVESWFPSQRLGEEKRWGFNGVPARDLEVVGTSVKRIAPSRGAANPVRLFLDGVPAAVSADVAKIAADLNAEPLARIMFGQRELFHTNLLAWFFEALPDIADRVFQPLALPGDGEGRSVDRERQNLDLVFNWPGFAPLVIENKVFSLPALEQLDRYAEKVVKWKGSAPELCILSMIAPETELREIEGKPVSFTPNGWRHLSYDSLADRLDEALEGATRSYEVETMRRYSSIVRLLSALIESTSVQGPESDEHVWLDEDELAPIASSQTRTALKKMRAFRLAALVGSNLQFADAAEADVSHGKPLVTWETGIEREGHQIRVGWQLQDGQFRRFAITPHIFGTSLEKKAERFAFARRHPDLFSFDGLDAVLGDPGAPTGPFKTESGFGSFGSDFVYKYVRADTLTVSQLVRASAWVVADIADPVLARVG